MDCKDTRSPPATAEWSRPAQLQVRIAERRRSRSLGLSRRKVSWAPGWFMAFWHFCWRLALRSLLLESLRPFATDAMNWLFRRLSRPNRPLRRYTAMAQVI